MSDLIIRASSIGGCLRSLVYQHTQELTGIKPREFTKNSLMVFAIGHALEPVILEAAGYDLAKHWFDQDQCEARVQVCEGAWLVGHPDGQDDHGYILEAKTMRSLSFKKVLEKGLEEQSPQYLMQVAVYVFGRRAPGVKFLLLDKDTDSLPHEIVYSHTDLVPWLIKALEKAEQIVGAVDAVHKACARGTKPQFPGKPEGMPGWACMKKYCLWWNCRYHQSQTAKGIAIGRAIKKKKRARAEAEYAAGRFK
jgi:hypothetical protein